MGLLDFTEVEFEPEREVWNVYELSDGSVIRIKSLLLKLFRFNQANPPLPAGELYSGRFQNVITLKRANPRLKWQRGGRRLTMQELKDQPKISQDFVALNEDWNIYHLESGEIVKVKSVATTVERLKEGWDEFDDPLYTVSLINVVQTVKRSLMQN